MPAPFWIKRCLPLLLLGLAACDSGNDAEPSASATPPVIDASGLPGWAIGPFTRYEGNPVMRPQGLGWESLQVLNPGVVRVDGEYKMLYRGIRPVLLSQTGLATSPDGYHWTRYENNPVFGPSSAEDLLATEDARLFQLDGTYYTFYTAVGSGTNLAEAQSTDLIHWTKLGVKVPGTKNGAVVTDPSGRPVRIRGEYVMYSGQMEDFSVWTSPDMETWTMKAPIELGYGIAGLPDEVCVAITDYPRRDGSTGSDIVLFTAGRLNPLGTWVYAISETLYSRADLTTQLDRLDGPVFQPQELYELVGITPVTVFMNSILYNGREWMMHYGAADTVIGVATAPAR